MKSQRQRKIRAIRVAAEVFLNKEFYEAAEVPYKKDSTLPSFGRLSLTLKAPAHRTEQTSSN
jgi:hypothetical protein